jgi:hypothetical protein
VDNDNLIFCHKNHRAMIGSTGGWSGRGVMMTTTTTTKV